MIWARFMTRRRFSAVRGIVTAMTESQALAEATRWLTGQIPQIRAINDGISENGRPWQNFSNPRSCVTWKRASATNPCSSNSMVILPWPSTRVTGLITMVCVMAHSLPDRVGRNDRRSADTRITRTSFRR